MAEKPGGVVTLRALRFWSPSLRVSSSEKGVWAAAVLPAEAAWKLGAKGRGAGRARRAVGAGVEGEVLGRGLFGKSGVPGGEGAVTG